MNVVRYYERYNKYCYEPFIIQSIQRSDGSVVADRTLLNVQPTSWYTASGVHKADVLVNNTEQYSFKKICRGKVKRNYDFVSDIPDRYLK